ncbi:MAG: RidA family protein [Gemmatimonadales bacterium]
MRKTLARASIGGVARWAVALCALTAGACTIEPRTDRVVEPPPDSSSVFIRASDDEPPAGVRSGDLVWIWGMTGTAPGAVPPRLVEGGIAAETRQALDNVLAVLEAAGAAARDVAQCSVFVADAADLSAMRAVYAEYFPTPPRRTAVAAAPLPLGARVEIECTAVAPPPV